MTRWIAWLVLSGKRYLKRPAFLLLLLVLPVAAAFFRREEEKEQPGIRIAVYGEEEDPDGFSKQLAEKLAGYGGESGSLFSFYLAGDEEELKRDVASGKAECGYVIHEGLEEKLKGKKFKGAISLYESPSTVAGLLSTETVFSLMIEAYDKELFLDYLGYRLETSACGADRLAWKTGGTAVCCRIFTDFGGRRVCVCQAGRMWLTKRKGKWMNLWQRKNFWYYK